MDLRVLLAASLLLVTAPAFAPGASAAPCATPEQVDCSTTVADCDLHAGANVITTTAVGARADCAPDNSRTRCVFAVGVGQFLLDPSYEAVCYY